MEIKLRNSNKKAVIDNRDEHLAQHLWSWHSTLGVVRYDASRYDKVKQRTPHLLLHRVITQAFDGYFVVHVNKNRLDNRRKNLLLLSPSAYAQFVRKPSGKSPFLGVTDKDAFFQVYSGGEYVGTFRDEYEAAKAYDEAALTRFGASARVNFPRKWEVCEECFQAHFVDSKCKCTTMNTI